MYTVYFTLPGSRTWLPSIDPIPYTVAALRHGSTHAMASWNWMPTRQGVSGQEALTTIFNDFQCDTMPVARREQWVAFCTQQGFNHTSLAVGDVILDQEKGEYWLFCGRERGFVSLPKA